MTIWPTVYNEKFVFPSCVIHVVIIAFNFYLFIYVIFFFFFFFSCESSF